MKKLLLPILAVILCISQKAIAQSCCAKPSDMQLMAMNSDFKAAHAAPLPFNYTMPKGSMVEFETRDSKKGHAYYIPSDQPTNKVLIIFHEWWGLNDYIKQQADYWQKQLGNIDVYAVDLYDGQVATDPDMASKLASGLDPKRAETIINGVLSLIGKDRQIATLGWCMGGSWSFAAARLAGNEASACVMYYGFPEKDEKKIKQVKCDVLYIWGSKDEFIKKPFVDQFGATLKANGNKFEFHEFEASHAFANPSNPNHNPLFTQQAEDFTLKFLKTKLQLD